MKLKIPNMLGEANTSVRAMARLPVAIKPSVASQPPVQGASSIKMPVEKTKSPQPAPDPEKPSKEARARQNVVATFFASLPDAIGDPSKCSALLGSSRLDGRLRRNLEDAQRERVAMAYAVHVEATAAGTLDELVAAIKSHSKVRSKDSRLVILFSLVDYGAKGSQYASRDKKVMEYLEMYPRPYEEAADFIKESGGLVSCAARFRDEKRRRSSQGTDEKQTETVKSACAKALTQADGCALVCVRRTPGGRKLSVLGEPLKLPPLVTEVEVARLWAQIKQTISRFGEGEHVPLASSQDIASVCLTNSGAVATSGGA